MVAVALIGALSAVAIGVRTGSVNKADLTRYLAGMRP
jgi:hypothetical protein